MQFSYPIFIYRFQFYGISGLLLPFVFQSRPSLFQELLASIEAMEFPAGKAQIAEVTKCAGDVSISFWVPSELFSGHSSGALV